MTANKKTRNTYSKMLKDYPDVLNIKLLSDALGGISTKTCYKMLKEGKIFSVKIGREYRIAKVSLIDFLMNRQ